MLGGPPEEPTGNDTVAQPSPPPMTPRHPSPESPPPTDQAVAIAPPECVPGLGGGVADMEKELKERMERHAKSLEQSLTADFLAKKRKAEEELEQEIDMKRTKRLMELEEDLILENEYKQSKLAGLDAQLAEKMQLVADEQTILDDLKDKAIEMQRKLEEEARILEPPKNPTEPTDPKSVMKNRLREKLEMTNKKKSGLEADAVAPKTPAEPSPPPSSGGPSPSPTPESTTTVPTTAVVVPTTDMRFSSSTHPAAWQFLYRITKKEDHCDKEIYDAWHAGVGLETCI